MEILNYRGLGSSEAHTHSMPCRCWELAFHSLSKTGPVEHGGLNDGWVKLAPLIGLLIAGAVLAESILNGCILSLTIKSRSQCEVDK